VCRLPLSAPAQAGRGMIGGNLLGIERMLPVYIEDGSGVRRIESLNSHITARKIPRAVNPLNNSFARDATRHDRMRFCGGAH
jgi:hypothetical protein